MGTSVNQERMGTIAIETKNVETNMNIEKGIQYIHIKCSTFFFGFHSMRRKPYATADSRNMSCNLIEWVNSTYTKEDEAILANTE